MTQMVLWWQIDVCHSWSQFTNRAVHRRPFIVKNHVLLSFIRNHNVQGLNNGGAPHSQYNIPATRNGSENVVLGVGCN